MSLARLCHAQHDVGMLKCIFEGQAEYMHTSHCMLSHTSVAVEYVNDCSSLSKLSEFILSQL